MAVIDQAYNRRDLEKIFGFSQAILAKDFLFISGCVSWDLESNPLHAGDMEKQIETVYADIDATLKAHGLDAADIVKETIYTRDIAGLAAANAQRLDYYKYVTPPASTWVQVEQLVHPDLLLEVEITAFRNR